MKMNGKLIGIAAGASVVVAAAGAAVPLLLTHRVWKKVRTRGYSLSGKTAVITGGSRGLGFALAREFLRRGARVALLARDGKALERARLSLLSHGRENVLAIQCDVTVQDQVNESLAVVRRNLGPIDILVNNAGVIAVGPMDSMTLDDYRDSIDLHFWAPLYATLAVLPEMKERKEGRIVNISSIGGKISVPHLLPYSAGKFALAGFSEGLRAEISKDKVYVTSVYPGLMRTGSPRNATFKGKHQAEYSWFSISGSMPGVSTSADRAARQIVNACQRGQAQLIVSLPAKIAIALHHLFPGPSAAVLSGVNRLLPGAGGIGSKGKTGKESTSWLSPSWLTMLDELAAHKNNEVAV